MACFISGKNDGGSECAANETSAYLFAGCVVLDVIWDMGFAYANFFSHSIIHPLGVLLPVVQSAFCVVRAVFL